MTPLAQFDKVLEQIISELTVRIVVPTFSEFESVWDAANRICDRYGLSKTTSAQPRQ